MITVMAFPDMKKFLDTVDSCKKDVLVVLPDGDSCSLKTDKSLRRTLMISDPGKNGLKLQTGCADDLVRIVDYMAHVYKSEKSA